MLSKALTAPGRFLISPFSRSSSPHRHNHRFEQNADNPRGKRLTFNSPPAPVPGWLGILAALVLSFWVHTAQAGSVVISEFMADNETTLADEDGSYPDWIEIYNAGTNAVPLEGWYLSNKSTNLTQWTFPSTNIGPRSFLIVFASGKDRRTPGAPLHANFKLNKSGEYLALTMPDGITKATEFAPTFPQQYADISYGYVMAGLPTTLIAPDANVRALVPGADLGTGWRQPNFDASTWTAGTMGIGYDTSGNYAAGIGLDLKNPMFTVNGSAYLRVPFSISDPAALGLLSLNLRYDDGFVAYLNGNEVLRRNAPASPQWNSVATATHGAPNPGSLTEDFEGAAANYTLSQYGSAPGPAVQPADADSTGKFLRLLYDGVNNTANSITFRQTTSGLFQTIIADFDFRLISAPESPADGFAFMLIPTSLYGTNGAGVNTSLIAVEQPNFRGVFGIGFRVYPHTSVNNVSAHWDGTRQVDVSIPTSTLDLAAGVFHHAQVQLQYTNGGALVGLTLTPDINGTPGTPYTVITNLFIAGLNPFDCRVQFGGRTGGLNMSCDLDNCRVQFLPSPGLIAFEDFDITRFADSLVAGQNLLAIQGLNASANDSDFLIQAELVGRNVTLAPTAGYLYPPSPGAWNGGASSAVVPTPVTFSPPAGAYSSNSLSVLLDSASSATIRYTLDGSAPGTNSPIYSAPLLITTSCVIRARAELGGILSEATAANYILLDSTVTNFSSNLPLMIVDTMGQTIPDGAKIGAYAVCIDTNSATGRATLSGAPDYIGRMGIGLHGQSSLGFPKQPYSIELDDETGASLDYPLLGFPPGSDWVLRASYDDKTFLNEVLTMQIFAQMGHYAVRTRYVELFLKDHPGKLTAQDYHGLYFLVEHIRVDKDRVNIAKLEPTDNASPQITGGYLFSKDKLDPDTDLVFTTSSGEQLILLYPKADKVTQPQLDYLTGYVNSFESALYGPNWRDPVSGYANYIDVASFVDFHWMVEYSKNIDGVRISDYMNKDRGGKIKTEPLWDWDLSWGNADYLEGGLTNGWYYPLMSAGDDIWLRQLRTDPDFYQKIIDRWGALRLNVFHPTNLLSRIDQITNYLWQAQARDFATWPRLGTYVWPNPDGAAGGWDVDYVNPTTYSGIIAQMKKFVLGRYAWIDHQFLRAPTLVTNGSSLTMSTPLGVIYYTVDGTDPRQTGGSPGVSARLYQGPVAVTNNVAVFARAFYTNSWSPPTQLLLITTLPTLRITEINYHPAPPPAGSPYTDKDFEFVEVQNTGTNPINLAGTRIGGGIGFTFAPNEWVPVGTLTTNDWDAPGTPFTASVLGQGPAPYPTNGGPGGVSLTLLNSTTNLSRNRIAFDQTATGVCQRVVADFDFRASSSMPAGSDGSPTLQDFDSPATAYTLSQRGTIPPAVMGPDAGSTGSYLRLVPSSGAQLGVAAFNRTATNGYRSIVATFDFRITPPSGSAPADGFGFALLSTSAYGNSGAGPNFGEEPNLTGSLGVGFDDYANASTPQEPNNNHVSVHWNGAQIGDAATPSFLMSDGRFHRAQVIVWFSGANAYVTVQLTPDINGTPGPTETVLQNILIPGATPYEARVAFGARTGGLWATHDVDNINVQYSQYAAAVAGLSLEFLPANRFGAGGPGSTLSDFTDSPRATNLLALDLSFNPSGLFNTVSLYWSQAQLTSVVLPPSSLDLDNAVFHHAHLKLEAGNGGAYTSLTLTPNSLGTPGAPLNLVSNLFIPGVGLGDSRVEFAARSGGLISRIALDNVAAEFSALAPLILNPGESIVVVHNLAAFISRYGTGVRVAGEFSGSLDNSGDRLTLIGPVGEPILDFTYDPSWYPATDGGGFTLVAVDPNTPPASWGLTNNWRPSSEPGGSPGAIDPPLIAPTLTIGLGNADQLTLEWPANAATYRLYSAGALGSAADWTLVTNTPSLSGDHWSVNLPVADRSRFYRLQQ